MTRPITQDHADGLRRRLDALRGRELAAAAGLIVAILLLLPRLLSFWDLASTLVQWPWQFDFDEGHNLNATVLLAHGTNIYQQNGPARFISAPYTPLFYVANAPFVRWLGPTFTPGRLMSALAAVTVALLLADIVHTVTRRRLPGALAGALWLSLSPVIVWAAFYKQDMPSLALQVAGVAWALRYAGANRRYGAVVIFALAFYVKQSAVAAGASVSLWLLVRDWRTGARFVGMMAAAIFVPFFGADFLLNGGLRLHVISYQLKPWNLGSVRQQFTRLWIEYWPSIVAAAGVLAGALTAASLQGRQSGGRARLSGVADGLRGPWGLIGLYSLAAMVWTFIATGIKGGNYNLLLEGLPVVALLPPLGAAWLLDRLAAQGARPRPWAVGGALLLAGLFVAQVALFADPRSWYRASWPSARQEQLMQAISGMIARTPGDFYSEDAYLLLHNGRPVLYDDPSTFPLLAEAGLWDDSVFRQSLRDRRFGLVILWPGSGRLTAVESRIFEANYALESADSLSTYTPKRVPDTPQYPVDCTFTLGADTIRLDGYSLGPGVARTGVRPGDVLRVALHWRAAGRPHRSYATFVHLVDADGKALAAHDEPSTGAGKPTPSWAPEQSVVDDLAVPLPNGAMPGRYRLVAGMYANEGGTLTPLVPACSDGGLLYLGAVAPGSVEVVGR